MMINEKLQDYRSKIDDIVKDLHNLTVQIGHEELSETVSDLRNRIQEPFMFVIVGEVKAGKSSFINALLGTEKDVCKVSPAPMTDTIQQILYGETENVVVINPFLKKLYYPIDILKEIAIVDTPGTNTIVANHQEITERFVPASDLIVFVFESKNPYRQSAWEFFDYIHADWRKKIIFVLQQKDLLSAEDLAINEQGVRDMAEKKGILHPHVFCVSAKLERESLLKESGFLPLRNYIEEHITGGRAPLLKLHNNIDTSLTINERIYNGLKLRKEQYRADIDFRKDIKQTLDHQEIKSNNQVDILKENLVATYDKITQKTTNELEEGLSFGTLLKRSFSSIFNKNASAKDWLNDLSKNLEQNLTNGLRDKLNDGVNDLSDSIQQMAKMIDLKIRTSKTILKDNHDIFSDIAERRSNILKDLQDTFNKFMNRAENFRDDSLFPEKGNSLAPNLATGGGIAIIGIILATVTKGMVMDVTGGVLTAVGLLFAGVTVGFQRRKILNGFQIEIDKGRQQMEIEMDEKLKTYIRAIKQKIDNNFAGFDSLLQNEAAQIQLLEDQHKSIEMRLKNIKNEL